MGIHIQRMLIFMPVFFLWFIMLAIVAALMKPGEVGRAGRKRIIAGPRDVVLILFFLACSAAVLLTLQYFRAVMVDGVFYLATGVMAAGALEFVLLARRRYLMALLFGWMYYSGLAYLGFVVLAEAWDWPALVVGAGLGFMIVAVRAAELLTILAAGEYSASLKGREMVPTREAPAAFRRLSTAYPLLVCLAPMCPATLAFFGYLPRPFTLMVVLVPLTAGLINRLQIARLHSQIPARFMRETLSAAWLYVIGMVLLFF